MGFVMTGHFPEIYCSGRILKLGGLYSRLNVGTNYLFVLEEPWGGPLSQIITGKIAFKVHKHCVILVSCIILEVPNVLYCTPRFHVYSSSI